MSAPRALRPVLPPTEATAAEAAAAARTLARVVATDTHSAQRVRVAPEGGAPEEVAVVPRAAFDLFVEILAQMANGNAVTVVPIHAELTTQQAADLLNVSRPFLVELLEQGKLPYRMVGTRRRVRYADLVAYQRADDEARKQAADDLTAEAESLGLDY